MTDCSYYAVHALQVNHPSLIKTNISCSSFHPEYATATSFIKSCDEALPQIFPFRQLHWKASWERNILSYGWIWNVSTVLQWPLFDNLGGMWCVLCNTHKANYVHLSIIGLYLRQFNQHVMWTYHGSCDSKNSWMVVFSKHISSHLQSFTGIMCTRAPWTVDIFNHNRVTLGNRYCSLI